jgi:hypothetical protein
LARVSVTLIEPIEMSQRPPQLPAVIRSQPGVSHWIAIEVPSFSFRRLTVSSAVEVSKPSYVPSGFTDENGA